MSNDTIRKGANMKRKLVAAIVAVAVLVVAMGTAQGQGRYAVEERNGAALLQITHPHEFGDRVTATMILTNVGDHQQDMALGAIWLPVHAIGSQYRTNTGGAWSAWSNIPIELTPAPLRRANITADDIPRGGRIMVQVMINASDCNPDPVVAGRVGGRAWWRGDVVDLGSTSIC